MTLTPQNIFYIALVTVLGSSVAVNGWFLRQVWAEVMSLRKSRHDHSNKLTEHEVRLNFLERGTAQ